MPDPWKPCASCKKPIAFGAKYYRCSVSTCNSGRFQLAFCTVNCWDAHVPGMSHRSNVWAIEERAPTRHSAEPERRLVRGPPPAPEEKEVLIIASRLKDFIKEEADFNTAADVMDILSDMVREATVDAIARARAEGRRTVMARDYRRGD